MKSIYIMINSLGVGGAEKSLVSFLNTIDLTKYHIYLQIINRGGAFESLIPQKVEILPEIPFIAFCNKSGGQQILTGHWSYLVKHIQLSMSLKYNDAVGHPLHDTQAYWRGASSAFDIVPKIYDAAIA